MLREALAAASFLLYFGGVSQAASPQNSAIATSTNTQHRAVIDRYCVTCHNDKLNTGGLSLAK